jgi:subtilisin family serine protease
MPKKTTDRAGGKAGGNGKLPAGPTGRKLVVLRELSQGKLIKSLKETAGFAAATTSDFEGGAVDAEWLSTCEALIFEELGVAVVSGDDSQIASLRSAVPDNNNPILAVEDEEYVQLLGGDDSDESPRLTASGQAYLQGFLDGIQTVSDRLMGDSDWPDEALFLQAAEGLADTDVLTWGLLATGADRSRQNGRGIRVAVLDTGMDLAHPDFAGRSPFTASFVRGERVQDAHGHGTHCIGTACGPLLPADAPRYGIAHEATLLAGKVVSDSGGGQDGWILAGINWAVKNRAAVISISIGATVRRGTPFKQAYETAAVNALNAGSLIIAAAGNSGNHRTLFPVNSPANCPSIMAVAALDQELRHAAFSARPVPQVGSEVNISGPGVEVLSSYKMPVPHASLTGTSMAAPHVAGCAALWAQQTGLRGKALWQKIEATAREVRPASGLVGAGLVQAPAEVAGSRPIAAGFESDMALDPDDIPF